MPAWYRIERADPPFLGVRPIPRIMCWLYAEPGQASDLLDALRYGCTYLPGLELGHEVDPVYGYSCPTLRPGCYNEIERTRANLDAYICSKRAARGDAWWSIRLAGRALGWAWMNAEQASELVGLYLTGCELGRTLSLVGPGGLGQEYSC